MGQEDAQIVPIDLESIQPGNATGLCYRDIEIPNLTGSEKDLVTMFTLETQETPFRYVPLPTSHFLGALTRCNAFRSLTKVTQENLNQAGYTPTMNTSDLESLFLRDLLNNDVPYLTSYQGKVYYGFPDSGPIIAEAKK